MRRWTPVLQPNGSSSVGGHRAAAQTLLKRCIALGAIGLFTISCGREGPTPPATPIPGLTALPGLQVPANGTGVCMGDDALAAGYINGQKNAEDLECTSEDLDIGEAQVTQFSLVSAAGPFTTLPAGNTIPCSPNQKIWIRTDVLLENNAQSRYDIGVWIATDGGNALTGTCNHYNLINGQNNSTNIDGDQCGDMASGVLATVPLDVLEVTCADNPDLAGLQVTVGACVGFQHQVGGADRVCPTGEPPGPAGPGFRPLTTPGTTAKCKCEPLVLPLDIKSELVLKKIIVNDDGGTTVTATPFGIVTNAGTPSFTCNTVGITTTCTSQSLTVNAGTYTFSESDVTGYTEGTWSCSPVAATGTAFGAGSVTLAAAQTTTCEITNNDQPASLTLVKKIVNDNGGTTVTATPFGIVTNAGTPSFTCNTVSNTTTCTSQAMSTSAGSKTFSESDVTGYGEGTWSCSPVAATGTAFGAGSVTLANGQSTTCEITNDDQAASLTLVKKIVNDHGGTTVTATPFGIVTNAGTPSFTCNTVGITTTCTSQAMSTSAGSKTFSESDVTGYSEGTWSCSPVAATGTAFGAGSVTLANGQSTTCEITNDDQPASLTLKKIIVNDNGGTAVVGDFNIVSNAGTPSFTCNTVGSTTTCTSQAMSTSAGSKTFSESDVAFYTEGTWSCTPVAATGTAFGAGSVTLANGQSTTCTITNNDDVRGRGQITPTGTSCDDFIGETSTTLATLFAQKGNNNLILNVAPGVFFYYAEVTKGAGAIVVTQTVNPNPAGLPPYRVNQDQADIYTVSGGVCSKVGKLTQSQDGLTLTGGANLPAGDYIIGIKFSTDAAVGTNIAAFSANALLATHNYSVGGGSAASVDTRVKP